VGKTLINLFHCSSSKDDSTETQSRPMLCKFFLQKLDFTIVLTV